MKKNILYTLIGIQGGFSYNSSFLFRKKDSNVEIACPINAVGKLHNLISKEDMVCVEEISDSLLSDDSKI